MNTAAHDLAASRGFLTKDDVDLIQDLVRSWPVDLPLRGIDLGAGAGTTALAVFCVRPTARVITIDVSFDALNWAKQVIENEGFGKRWYSLLVDSAAAGRNWVGEVDLLLVDAGHSEKNVVDDIRAWLPKMKPGGLIWVHDYASPPKAWGQEDESPGVRSAIKILIDGGMIEAIEARGLSWAGKKA